MFPPFSSTLDIHSDIITASDHTSFQGVSDGGQHSRTMFDRRINDWITVNAYLIYADFDDGLSAKIQVNPEFGSAEAALAQAQKYAEVLGRLPTALRREARVLWIHQGMEPFGGGKNHLLIHTGQAALYEVDGILEEAIVQAAAHTSLDPTHTTAPGWREAQRMDGTFISTYALEFPDTEDIAESFLPYLAIRYRATQLPRMLTDTIGRTIPNRIAYFDAQAFDMYPMGPWSLVGVEHTSIRFTNHSKNPISTYWVNYEGQEVFYSMLPPDTSYVQPTYVTHPWRVRATETGLLLRSVLPTDATPLEVRITRHSKQG